MQGKTIKYFPPDVLQYIKDNYGVGLKQLKEDIKEKFKIDVTEEQILKRGEMIGIRIPKLTKDGEISPYFRE